MRDTLRIFKTLDAQNEAAKSGNRPRFKRIVIKKLASGVEKLQVTSVKSSPLLLFGCLLFVIISAISFTSANCDLSRHQSQEANLQLHVHRHHRLFHQSASQTDGTARRKRHFVEPSQQKGNAIKVVALASKLEQWFTCRRLANSTPETAGAQSRNAPEDPFVAGSVQCPAHFDGHLCWPAARSGQSVKLPCPRLNWLPGQQEKYSVKSVISSIQLPAQSKTNMSTPESIKSTTSEGPIFQDANVEVSFAYRKCEQATIQKIKSRSILKRQSINLMLESPASFQFGPTMAANNEIEAKWQTEADYSECRSDEDFDPTDKWIKLDQASDRRLFSSLVDELDRIEGTIDPYIDPDLQEQWRLCISNIMQHQMSAALRLGQGDLWCPIIFDGWRCWPSTKAGETAYVSCPSNQPGFSAEHKAHKICTPDGSWYRHPETNRYWSNYTTCVDTADLAFRTKILNLYVIGNLISLLALAASLIIFISFKSLNCTRVTIHKNLFLSFITNNLMWIIWYTCVVNDADLLQSNPVECQIWHILLHYFLVSNYFWMFCEGLYLHTLLVVAFVSEDKILKWFYLLGWLIPAPITVAYAYNRFKDGRYTDYCWMDESPYNLILMTPIGISLLINLVFLINIVRVLVTKLRANNSPDTHQTRKAVRATLILIPLLGLHYILTPFRPEAKSEWEVIYESVAAVCTSFQGFCVAMLFCFCNGEVITVVKKKLKDTFNLSQSAPRERLMRSRNSTGTGTITNASLCSAAILVANNNSNQHIQKGNHILGSVISTSTQNGEPLQRPYGITNIGLGTNRTSSNNSNSSSLLTTVTASPIHLVTNSLLSDTILQTKLRGPETTVIAIATTGGNLGLAREETVNLLNNESVTLANNSIRDCSMTTSFSSVEC